MVILRPQMEFSQGLTFQANATKPEVGGVIAVTVLSRSKDTTVVVRKEVYERVG